MTHRMLVLAGLGLGLAGCQPAAPPPTVLPTQASVAPGPACANALATQEGVDVATVATTAVTANSSGGSEVALTLDGAAYTCRLDASGSLVTVTRG